MLRSNKCDYYSSAGKDQRTILWVMSHRSSHQSYSSNWTTKLSWRLPGNLTLWALYFARCSWVGGDKLLCLTRHRWQHRYDGSQRPWVEEKVPPSSSAPPPPESSTFVSNWGDLGIAKPFAASLDSLMTYTYFEIRLVLMILFFPRECELFCSSF